jgi:putative transposase
VLAWRLSNTMDTAFCVSALEEALPRFGKPEIFSGDQGSQFTSAIFTATLSAAGVRISMDGRGRWMDNVFIERLLRSLKYEDIYLKGYADGHEAKRGIADWVTFYKPRIGTPIRLCH